MANTTEALNEALEWVTENCLSMTASVHKTLIAALGVASAEAATPVAYGDRLGTYYASLHLAPKGELPTWMRHMTPLYAAPQASQHIGQPVSEQNARFAIDGAIEYGKQGINQPPSADHWLMPYWEIGRALASNSQPVSGAVMTDEYAEELKSDLRRLIHTEINLALEPFNAGGFAAASTLKELRLSIETRLNGLLSASGQAVSEKAHPFIYAVLDEQGEIIDFQKDRRIANDVANAFDTHGVIPLFTEPQAGQAEKQGWYCANCGKGVPPEEVTYSEHHTLCGGPVGGWPEQTEAPVNVNEVLARLRGLHVGESSFEDWFADYLQGSKGTKQIARDAYAAGMEDPLVAGVLAAAPAPVQTQQSEKDAQDAKRYRHLRDCNSGNLVIVKIIGMGDDDQVVLTERDADAEIDAALSSEQNSGEKGGEK